MTFNQEKKKSDPSEDESALYAVPIKPDKRAAQETKTAIYDTPKKQDKPVDQEPQDSGPTGFFNPLYQSRREVEEFPEDISSIFASPSRPSVQTLDDDLGQSDC